MCQENSCWQTLAPSLCHKVRFEFLKKLMGMRKLPAKEGDEKEVEKKKGRKNKKAKVRTASRPTKTAILWLQQLRFFA